MSTAPGPTRHFHDPHRRRLLAQGGIADQADLNAHTEKAQYQPGTHQWLGADGQAAQYDQSGLPQSMGQRSFEWDALGRLRTVSEGGKPLARYVYNHHGERISRAAAKLGHYLYQDGQLVAELDEQGLIRRQYVYLADLPLVVIDSSKGQLPESGERGLFSRVQRDLRIIFRSWLADDERMVWLHTNHLGAIEAATDQAGKPVWRATWQASGALKIASRNFALQLRLPGQYEDEDTGLYYNRHRWYDPRRGAYLTPDPLGTPDGPNPYAYVRGNPLRYVDPSGLVLFAFDGTENSDPVLHPNKDTLSNVVEFRKLYNDGNTRYISGVGTVDRSDPARPILAPDKDIGPLPRPDKGFNWSGPERIARMVEYFGKEAGLIDDSTAMDVDIVGFSRGAAQARDFSNRIVANTKMISGTNTGWYGYTDTDTGEKRCQKVNFRFMGLWDTVLSTNWSGYSYNLGIPAEFAYVAQAVALNEYRDNTSPDGRPFPRDWDTWGAFPMESIMGGKIPEGQTRIERGFLGSHADIGGGFEDNALSKVALAWMVEQADKAHVKMDTSPILIAANPVLHDKSTNIQTGRPAGSFAEDRKVRYLNGTTVRQREMTTAGMSYADIDSEGFITYTDRSLLPRDVYSGSEESGARIEYKSNKTGTVDIKRYLGWLKDHGYDLNYLTVQ